MSLSVVRENNTRIGSSKEVLKRSRRLFESRAPQKLFRKASCLSVFYSVQCCIPVMFLDTFGYIELNSSNAEFWMCSCMYVSDVFLKGLPLMLFAQCIAIALGLGLH